MRIELRQTPLLLLVALVVPACTDIPAPRDRTGAPGGESMQPLEPDEQEPGNGGNPPITNPPPNPSVPVPTPPPDPCLTRGTGCTDDDADAGTGGDGGANADAGAPVGRSCEAGGQSFADGAEVPSGDSCNSCSCTDGDVTCTEAACDPVFCAEFVEESDAVCSRFPLDPCSFQDPDCESVAQPTEP